MHKEAEVFGHHSALVIAQRLMEAKPVKTSLLLAPVLGTDPPPVKTSLLLAPVLGTDPPPVKTSLLLAPVLGTDPPPSEDQSAPGPGAKTSTLLALV
ncbi:unnamed protein product [Boreogadus saida]